MAPRNINYDNTYFYKICCKDINIKEIYIGHTTDFTRRKYSHGHACYNEKQKDYNMRIYKFIRDNGGWDNWDMILIEHCNCENRLCALRKEREYIEHFEATLNKQIPTQTSAEYMRNKYGTTLNKQTPTQTHKEYYQQNRDRILAQKKEYNNQHKEHIKEYSKQYKLDNKDILKEKAKQRNINKIKDNIITKKDQIHELLKTHIQDLNIIEEILALV